MVFKRNSKELEDICSYALEHGVEVKNSMLQKNPKVVKGIIDFCLEKGMDIIPTMFARSEEEVKDIVHICEQEGIDLSGSIFYRSPEEVRNLGELCHELKVDVEASFFLRSFETTKEVFDFCKSKGIKASGAVFTKTKEDLEAFNKLNISVVKYYNNFEQFGSSTLGENIADLGAMRLIMDIAKLKKANDSDYKKIFENYALDWCSQMTPYANAYLLYNDVHSPNKNRTNAVLSSTDEFYKVYDIKETDDMFIAKKDRVFVW